MKPIQETLMKTIDDKLEPFTIVGVKPGFNHHEENGDSAFVLKMKERR